MMAALEGPGGPALLGRGGPLGVLQPGLGPAQVQAGGLALPVELVEDLERASSALIRSSA